MPRRRRLVIRAVISPQSYLKCNAMQQYAVTLILIWRRGRGGNQHDGGRLAVKQWGSQAGKAAEWHGNGKVQVHKS